MSKNIDFNYNMLSILITTNKNYVSLNKILRRLYYLFEIVGYNHNLNNLDL